MIKIIDNCLDYDHLNCMQRVMFSDEFPWYFHNNKVSSDKPLENEKYDYQLIHMFYSKFSPKSHHTTLIDPILEILNPSALVRIKANLLPSTETIVTYPYHVDYKNFNGKTAIFYVNSNDGYTKFENGEKIESIENRLIIFDASMPHAGSTSTNTKARAVINFNYYSWS